LPLFLVKSKQRHVTRAFVKVQRLVERGVGALSTIRALAEVTVDANRRRFWRVDIVLIRIGQSRRIGDVAAIEAETIEAIPMNRLIRPDDIANAVLFFCSPMANVITGQSIAVDGGSAQAVMY
jgi:enoyl-[acyl-carrier-protein] reductase (NADH)